MRNNVNQGGYYQLCSKGHINVSRELVATNTRAAVGDLAHQSECSDCDVCRAYNLRWVLNFKTRGWSAQQIREWFARDHGSCNPVDVF